MEVRSVVRLVISVLVMLAALLTTATTSNAKSPALTISGVDLPYTVTASFQEQQAFYREQSSTIPTARPKNDLGMGYVVTSVLWTRWGSRDGEATYYPRLGVASISREADEQWVLLDRNRRALLDRYIALARSNRISPEPSVLDLVVSASSTENISVRVAGRALNQSDAAQFWQEAKTIAGTSQSTTLGEIPSHSNAALPRTVEFMLPEGRMLTLRFYASGYLVDAATVEAANNPSTPITATRLSDRLKVLLSQTDSLSSGSGSPSLDSPSDPEGARSWLAPVAVASMALIAVLVFALVRWHRVTGAHPL